MTDFQKGYRLVIEGAGLRGEYNLDGTYRALDFTFRCAVANIDYVGQPASKTPLASNTDPALLFQLATEIITDFGVRDAKFLTRAELTERELKGAVSWVSKETGVTVAVMMFPWGREVNLRDTDGPHTDYLSKDCDGDIATTATDIEAGYSARQLRVLCINDKNGYESYLTKVVVGEDTLLTVIRFENGGELPNGKENGEASKSAALLTASFVIEN